MERKFGILFPIFSLDGKYGIGSFGKVAYDFVDFLAECKVSVWQVLPLCPVGYGASPYSSPCTETINPYFIDIDILWQNGLLTKAECKSNRLPYRSRVNYDELSGRIELLKKAFDRYNGEICGYVDYALFMALKEDHGDAPWYEWGDYADYDSQAVKDYGLSHKKEIEFWQFVQTIAFKQWNELRAYANGKDVKIMGDMPFYVSHDSMEVWRDKSLFDMDGYMPKTVAGVPPDYFSKSGQLWGNPVYNWHNKKTYAWWNKRINDSINLFDIIRLDHFRAFDEYYVVPNGSEDAINGEWKKGPGFEFFKDITNLPIVAEDLGTITHSVKALLARTGYPGMRVLQFGFDGTMGPHCPSAIGFNSVCYTGTHDNMTLKQFIVSHGKDELSNLLSVVGNEIGEDITDVDELIDAIIELGCATDGLFIVPLADLMHKGKEYRINTPSTVSKLNWSRRIKKSEYVGLKEYISVLIQKYNRR